MKRNNGQETQEPNCFSISLFLFSEIKEQDKAGFITIGFVMRCSSSVVFDVVKFNTVSIINWPACKYAY